MTKDEQLQRLNNRPTRYELVAQRDGQRVLIGYTSRKGRAGLLSMLRQRLQDNSFGNIFSSNDMKFRDKAADGADVAGWYVHFTGRTQRESIIGGECLFIQDVAKVGAV